MSNHADMFAAKMIGQQAISEMLSDAPDLEARFIRSELWRFTKRIRRLMVKERFRGRPGINWKGPTGPKATGGTKNPALGKNIQGWVRKSSLTAEVKISRFLGYHEKGTTGVRAVPARLEFEELFNREKVLMKPRLNNAMQRAADALDKRANKKIASSSKSLIFASRF